MILHKDPPQQSLLMRRIRSRLHLLSHPRARRTPVQHVAGALPAVDGAACLFVSYAPAGRFSLHVRNHMAMLAEAGFAVIAIAVMDDPDLPVDPGTCPAADLVLKRRNSGFDFGAWAAALDAYPALWSSRRLLFANDSVYALQGPAYRAMLERFERSESDVQALVESLDRGRHFQSYFFCLRSQALQSRAVRSFWRGLRDFEDKQDVINYYEIRQLKKLERASLAVDIVHRLKCRTLLNPTIALWKNLLEEGFPFLKVELLRDAPNMESVAEWPELASALGADLEPIESHLEQVAPDTPALQALHAWRARLAG